jgi:hypothetical protein
MNTERILDIALAANPNIKRTQGDIGGKSWIAANGIPPQSVVKFAELIVRECVDIARVYSEEGVEYNGGDAIREHFGVEL